MPSAFQSEKAKGLNIVFQYKISGSDNANYHLIIKDGNLVIESGIHSSPTTTILMKDEDFLNMAQGKLQPMQAFTTGKLKIEGDMMKSQLLEKLFKLK